MDEMYNNENNSSFENQDGAYGGQYQQPSVQDQLQYQYQQPESNLEEPMTLGEWLITMLIMLIPCVNIIMAFVWAFSSKEKKSKSNYFKAWLIYTQSQFILINKTHSRQSTLSFITIRTKAANINRLVKN